MADLGAASRQLEPHLYSHVGEDAVHHSFGSQPALTAWWLESRRYWASSGCICQCKAAGLTGPTLNRAVERAISAAKKVRTDTGIGRQVVSISSVAVQLAKQIFGNLGTKNTALLVPEKWGHWRLSISSEPE